MSTTDHENDDRRPGDVTEQNIHRLLGQAYRPEAPDPAFVRQLTDRLRAATRDAVRTRQILRTADAVRAGRRHRRRALAAAAALILVAFGLHLLLQPRTASRETKQVALVPPNGRAPVHPSAPAQPPQTKGPAMHGMAAWAQAAQKPQPPDEPRLMPRPLPAAPLVETVPLGNTVQTAPGERRRVALADGSVISLNGNTSVQVAGERQLKLAKGEVFVEVAPRPPAADGATFTVQTSDRQVAALGTKFDVRSGAGGTGVAVTQGKVRVSGLSQPVQSGQELEPGSAEPGPAPRASYLLDWARDLFVAAESPLVPRSKYAGGALVATAPGGQEAQISLSKYHVDVHVEDGFARTTIDQTYFNHEAARLEGTFLFPLPADASLSRLAMYVDGRLMEGGMAERDYARQVFENIARRQKDPALLEWVDGTTFRMRVFPLEPHQEKRIILSYTQRLPSLYGRTQYRFPASHSLGQVAAWSFHARVKNGAGLDWSSPSHKLTLTKQGSDLLLDGAGQNVKVDRDVVLDLVDRGVKTGTPDCFSSAVLDGSRYLMLRYRPTLAGNARRQRRDWVFLFESSGDRDPLLARAQVEVVRTLLANAEHDDTFAILTAGSRVQTFARQPRPATPENVQAGLDFLEHTHLVGALDLGGALTAAEPFLKAGTNPYLVHLGSGLPALGEHREEVLARQLPEKTRYVGVAVGKHWARGFMKAAAERTDGYVTQINPDEPIGWRAFELFSTLNTPRLLNVQVVDNAEKARFLTCAGSLAQGEELCAVARTGTANEPLPESLTISGILDGKPYRQVVPVREVADKADYLPRTWARLEIDRLLAEDPVKNRQRIVDLSRDMYVMTPFTSLLVLENEAMYAQYRVDRGRKDHWALYPCPNTLPEAADALANREMAKQDAPRAAMPAPAVGQSTEQVLQSILMRVPPPALLWPSRGDESGGRRVVSAHDVYSGAFALPEQAEEAKEAPAADRVLPAGVDKQTERSVPEKRGADDRKAEGLAPESMGLKKSPAPAESSPPPTAPTPPPGPVPGMARPAASPPMQAPASATAPVKGKAMPALTGAAPAGGPAPPAAGLMRSADAPPAGSAGRGGAGAGGMVPPAGPATGAAMGPGMMPAAGFGGGRGSGAGNATPMMQGMNGAFRPQPGTGGGGMMGFGGSSMMGFGGGMMGGSGFGGFGGGSFGGGGPWFGYGFGGAPQLNPYLNLLRADSPAQNYFLGIQPAAPVPDQDLGLRMRNFAETYSRPTALPYYPYFSDAAEHDRLLRTGGFGMMGRDKDGSSRELEQVLKESASPTTRRGSPLPQARDKQHRDAGRDGLGALRKEPQSEAKDAAAFKLLRSMALDRAGEPPVVLSEEALRRAGPDAVDGWIARLLADGPPSSPLYERPSFSRDNRLFTDLLAYAPGMSTSRADVLAVLEAEAADQPPPAPGAIDPAARGLIDAARVGGWRKVTFPARDGRPAWALVCDGTGRYAYEHTLPAGLVERVVCDGRTLRHLYPELGVGASRRVSRFHRADFVALVPWLLPPVEDLARGADVRSIDGRTVAVCPHGAGVEVRLVFAPDGRLAERCQVELPAGKVLGRKTYAANGTVRSIDADGKETVTRVIVTGAPAPDLEPDTRQLVVLPLPLRTRQHVLEAHLPQWNGNVNMLAPDQALELVAADSGDAEVQPVILQRFVQGGDRRPGFVTLLAATGLAPEQLPPPDAQAAPQLARYLRWLQHHGTDGAVPGPGDGLFGRLAAFHGLAQPWWRGDGAVLRPDEYRRLVEFVGRGQSPALAWALVSLVLEDRVRQTALPGGMAAVKRGVLEAACRSLDRVPGLVYCARYEQARLCWESGERDRARELFQEAFARGERDGLLPRVDATFRQALRPEGGRPDAWTPLVREAAHRLLEGHEVLAVLDLARQCALLNDQALADELSDTVLKRVGDEPHRLPLSVAAVQYLRHTHQYDRADALLRSLLSDSTYAGRASLWRLAARVAGEHRQEERAWECLDRALELEYRHLPEEIDLEAVRRDYGALLGHYEQLAGALATLHQPPPAGLLPRVVSAADRWRALDVDGTVPCVSASRILKALGKEDLAWDYLTTPLAGRPADPAVALEVARALSREGSAALADRAYRLASEADPANAQVLWEEAQCLEQAGKRDAARQVLRQVAEGNWAEQYRELQRQARSRLGGSLLLEKK
jgi:ferric-dicitrate binding protein FerR (iron transport regulator)/tetratricopeptide (TPR) repeat protein